MVGAVAGHGRPRPGSRVETTLDPAAQPFLHDHRIDGTPVLPGVMGIEAFAEVAALAAARLAGGRHRGRRVPRPVQVLPRRAAHAHAGGACHPARRRRPGRATAALSGQPTAPTGRRAPGARRTSPARSGSRPAPLPARARRAPGHAGRGGRRRDDIYRVLLPWPRLPGARRGLADDGGTPSACSPAPAAGHDRRRPVTPRPSPGWSSCASRRPGCGRSATTGQLGAARRTSTASSCCTARQPDGQLFAIVASDAGRRRFRLPRSSTATGDVLLARRRLPHRRRCPAAVDAELPQPLRDAMSLTPAAGDQEPHADFARLAIVNRGEPAMRCTRRGRRARPRARASRSPRSRCTPSPTRHAWFVREADEAVPLGPATFVDPRRAAASALPRLSTG